MFVVVVVVVVLFCVVVVVVAVVVLLGVHSAIIHPAVAALPARSPR